MGDVKYRISVIERTIHEYVEENRDSLPNMKDCCLQNGWDYGEIMVLAKQSRKVFRAIQNLKYEREVILERGGILGNYNKPLVVHLLAKSESEEAEETRLAKLLLLDSILEKDIEIAGRDSASCTPGGVRVRNDGG